MAIYSKPVEVTLPGRDAAGATLNTGHERKV